MFYVLDENKIPTPCDDDERIRQMFLGTERIVKKEHVGSVKVSTVFLAIDHNWSMNGPPVLFETMTFDNRGRDEFDRWQNRCVTYLEALDMHERMKRDVLAVMKRLDLAEFISSVYSPGWPALAAVHLTLFCGFLAFFLSSSI